MTATAALPATALGGLLLSMADDEFVIGFSDSEWTGIAPLLEEDVAMSSLAQDELGQGRGRRRRGCHAHDDRAFGLAWPAAWRAAASLSRMT